MGVNRVPPPLVGQRDAAPTRKMQAVMVAGAVVNIGIWLVHDYAGVAVPPEAAGSITTLVGMVAGYIVKDRRNA
ncbi:MAG: hypothetical protein AAFR07_05560 [Pseudomonadota bacterium]